MSETDQNDLLQAVYRIFELRDARLRETRLCIECGSYRIDPRKVAEKMLGARCGLLNTSIPGSSQ